MSEHALEICLKGIFRTEIFEDERPDGQRLIDKTREKRLFAVKVVVDQTFGDARFAGDHTNGSSMIPVLGEGIHRGREKAFFGFQGVCKGRGPGRLAHVVLGGNLKVLNGRLMSW
jgi:hypothetical protein